MINYHLARCPYCAGSGIEPSAATTFIYRCEPCNGAGRMRAWAWDYPQAPTKTAAHTGEDRND